MNNLFKDELTVENLKTTRTNMIISGIPLVLFIIGFIYGIVQSYNPNYSAGQATLIIIESLAGCLACFSFPIVNKLFGLQVGKEIRIFIMTFAVCAIFLGEACEFYYIFPWWDTLLHTISGVGVTMVAYALVRYLFKTKNINSFAAAIAIAIMFSLSIGLVWEIYEFSVDSLCGTNMQKFMPEVDFMFNGGNTFDTLNGSLDEIGNFYLTPEGYRYALMDTMKDIICCFVGSVAFLVIAYFLYRKNGNDSFTNVITIKKKQ